MSTSPIRQVPLEKKVADLLRRVGELERKAKGGGASTLDALRDTEVLYDHWTDLPRHDQALRWDTTRESKFHGLASFADPTIVADSFTTDVTGEGSFLIDEDLVDGSWDVSRPCLVTVTGIFQAGYASQEVDPPTTPPTYVRPPSMVMVLTDSDGGAVSTFGDGAEQAVTIWPVEEDPSDTTALGHQGESVSWLFLRGTPHLTMWCVVGAGAAAGLSTTSAPGEPSPVQRIAAITRVTRL